MQIEEARIRLSGSQVDYEATMAAKLCLAKKVFDRFWLETQSSAAYQVGAHSCRWTPLLPFQSQNLQAFPQDGRYHEAAFVLLLIHTDDLEIQSRNK